MIILAITDPNVSARVVPIVILGIKLPVTRASSWVCISVDTACLNSTAKSDLITSSRSTFVLRSTSFGIKYFKISGLFNSISTVFLTVPGCLVILILNKGVLLIVDLDKSIGSTPSNLITSPEGVLSTKFCVWLLSIFTS